VKNRAAFQFGALIVFLLAASTAFGAEEQYWMLLEKGKRLFREGLYGDAMIQFEDAIRSRRSLFEGAERSFIDALSMPDVRNLGDDLAAIEAHIEARRLLAAGGALATLYSIVERESLSNSAQRALSRFKDLKAYPEAEYWLGEVYRIEGETAIALAQYQKALDARSQMEIPEEARIVRSRMAMLHAQRREYNAMESQLLAILSEDPLWSDQRRGFVRDAMIRNLVSDGVDRFLVLYRHENTATYEAQRDLGVYYYLTGRHDRGFLPSPVRFPHGRNVGDRRSRLGEPRIRFHVIFRNAQSGICPGTCEGAPENGGISKGPVLSCRISVRERPSTSRDGLWRLASTYPDSGEWGRRSARQLAAPFIEPSTETP
jgi:tetratricopeptide (TPR) repeat protein